MRWVALLYTVVLTPERRVKAAELQKIVATAGFGEGRTVLSTGNVVFDAEGDAATLEARLEAVAEAQLGKAIPIFMRSAEELRAVLAANPYPEATVADPSRVAVRFLRKSPSAEALARIEPDKLARFQVQDRALWLMAEMELSQVPLHRKLSGAGVGPGTWRSASALAKIAAAL